MESWAFSVRRSSSASASSSRRGDVTPAGLRRLGDEGPRGVVDPGSTHAGLLGALAGEREGEHWGSDRGGSRPTFHDRAKFPPGSALPARERRGGGRAGTLVRLARVVESADTEASKASARKGVRVRIPLRARTADELDGAVAVDVERRRRRRRRPVTPERLASGADQAGRRAWRSGRQRGVEVGVEDERRGRAESSSWRRDDAEAAAARRRRLEDVEQLRRERRSPPGCRRRCRSVLERDADGRQGRAADPSGDVRPGRC